MSNINITEKVKDFCKSKGINLTDENINKITERVNKIAFNGGDIDKEIQNAVLDISKELGMEEMGKAATEVIGNIKLGDTLKDAKGKLGKFGSLISK